MAFRKYVYFFKQILDILYDKVYNIINGIGGKNEIR